jgi:D-alanyl-D-alanine dipeptidase
LWRWGFRALLPNHYVRRVPVVESGEPLVELRGGSLFLDSRSRVTHAARKSIVDALIHADSLLPGDLKLLVVEAYRPLQRQEELWERAYREAAEQNPGASAEELDRITNLVVGNPHRGRTNGHQTGAAVDLTLADSQGRELWMGTEVQQFAAATPTDAEVASEVRHRRKLLVDCMTQAGFANYPGEWWHFSLGDQLWAAYRRMPTAKFGALSQGAAEPA